MTDTESCLIMGAGIAGLLAAQRLVRYDLEVTLIEKNAIPGGRMSIRKEGEAVFDTGAQFMTTRDMIFRERVESWLTKGETLPWYPGPLKNMRYVGSRGMTTVTDRIASDLNVRLSETVTRLRRTKTKWKVTTQKTDSGEKMNYEADWLVLTAPVPLNMRLLDDSGIEIDFDDEDELRKISYMPCLAAMAHLNGPSGLPNPGAMDLNHSVLRWIGDNHMKGISPVPGTVTFHSSRQFAEANWDKPDDEWMAAMLAAAKPFIKSDVVSATSRKWLYSDPTRIFMEKHPFRKSYYLDEDLQLGMAGDGFGGARIEAAGLSGMELASAIISPI
ncbi:MAG: NAD(P)/FAD-dependent oxidoreductase [Puniceicoccaceae bacterium]